MSLYKRFSLTIVMKIKNKTKTQILWVALIVLILIVGYMYQNPKLVEVPVGVPVMPVPPRPVLRQERSHSPEFRQAPIKQYKPGHMQQMGILTGEGDETLPLYGKEVRGRRDRYHYYTTTGGENLYPLPVSHDGRDCIDDIGCQELYGNEAVSVTGKTGSFNVNLYRTDDFF
jgi:hypothetical protein|tara:strand:- start:347 stop:862 length:516 start_codon:yes stop_codon:yes gene_type:complete